MAEVEHPEPFGSGCSVDGGAAGNRTPVLRCFVLSSTGVVHVAVRFVFPMNRVRLLGTVFLIVLAHTVQDDRCALPPLLKMMPRTL